MLVGADGVPRVLDFGVAKAATRLQTTRDGQLKGKIPYMAPEQIAGQSVTAQSDVYSAALVLWEALTWQRLFRGETEAQVLHLVMTAEANRAEHRESRSPARARRGRDEGSRARGGERWATAREMAVAIEAAVPVASPMKVAEWVDAIIGKTLAARDAIRADIESGSHSNPRLAELSAPMSTPSLPAFPQVGESSSSLPRPDGIAESTASLVVGAEKPSPARSRVPYIAAGVAIVGLIGVGIGVAVSHTSTVVTRASAADSPPPLVTTPPPPTPSASVTASATAVVEITPTPSATSSHHHPSAHPHAAGTSTSTSSNDLKTLLDTR